MLNWRKYKYGKGFYLSNIKKYIRKQLKRKKKKKGLIGKWVVAMNTNS